MKISLRPPCKECPFRKKSARGWLGPDTAQEVWMKVHGDGPFGYPCHMDTDKALAAGHDLMDPDSVEQCVGAMLHASKTAKNYSDRFKEAGKQVLAKLLGTDDILGMEFMEHHKSAGEHR